MTFEILETVFKRMNDYLKEFPDESIQLTWHGGEPCLLGPDYFRKALEYQRTYCRETENRIRHLIQSNMTCLTQELVDVFKELKIDMIGSSYDPIEGIRGIGEKRDSKIYKELFFKGTELAERNNLSWGVIYVVHRRSLENPVGILNHLKNINTKTTPAFNKIYIYGDDPFNINITPEEYADFLGKLVPIYLANPEKYEGLRPIDMFIRFINGKGGLLCDYAGNCANHWLYIGPTGKLSQCGKAGDENLADYGNIRNTGIRAALEHSKRDIINKRQIVLKQTDCKYCRFWGMCHGGCPIDTLALKGDIMKRGEACEIVQRLMTQYIEPLTGNRIEMFPNE